jgi:hypothetical protein
LAGRSARADHAENGCSLFVPEAQLAAGATDENVHRAWTEALAAIVASLGAKA